MSRSTASIAPLDDPEDPAGEEQQGGSTFPRSPPQSPSARYRYLGRLSLWDDIRSLCVKEALFDDGREISAQCTWRKATHPIARLERFLIYFGLHTISPNTLRYCKTVNALTGFKVLSFLAFLMSEAPTLYTPVSIISSLWLTQCITTCICLVVAIRRPLREHFHELCQDPDPDMSRHLRAILVKSLMRGTAPCVFVMLGNTFFLSLCAGGAFTLATSSFMSFTLYFRKAILYPFPMQDGWSGAFGAAIWAFLDIYPTASWILGMAVCYWSMLLLLERMKRLEAELREGRLPLAELRAAHTRACELLEKVDKQFMHFTTIWLLLGWTTCIFLLNLLLLSEIDWILKGAAIFWLTAGVSLLGILSITAAALQGTHQDVLRTLMKTNRGLEDKLELLALSKRLQAYQPGMSAAFGTLVINWRFLITISSTISSAFVLLTQLQKAGGRIKNLT